MKNRALKMDLKDNVATTLGNIAEGDVFAVVSQEGEELETLIANRDIRFGYKVALTDILVGDSVLKYGEIIGICYKEIKQGDMVHIQNIKSNRISIPDDRINKMINEMNL